MSTPTQGTQFFYSPIPKDEKISPDDFVEDLATGRRERVSKSFYAFLRGQRVSQALKLPSVYQVVRKTT